MKGNDRDIRRQRAAQIQGMCDPLWTQGRLQAPRLFAVSDSALPLKDAPSQFEVLPTDSHSAAFEIAPGAGVLIFGSGRKPGGGWRNGAKAQEEDVSLVSTWGYQAEQAPPGFYQDSEGMGPDAALLAHGFWLFDQYDQQLPVALPCVFASVAAPNRAAPTVAAMDVDDLVPVLARRLERALEGSRAMGVDTLILGAIGCGVFQWPASHSALAMRQALASSRWRGRIILAMPDPALASEFSRILSQEAGPGPVSNFKP